MQIQLQNLIPKNNENSYFYQNGLSKVIPRLTLKVISKIDDCYELWNKFSPNENFFDLWDFRYAWYSGYKCKPHFYTLYEGDVPQAVLPLWFDDELKRYETFGSWYMEDNRVFTRDERFIDLIFEVAPSPLFLNSIKLPSTTTRYNRHLSSLQNDDPKNIKNIAKFRSMDDYLMTLAKKHRYNLKADYKKIQALSPRIIITEGKNDRAFKNLIKLNKKRFNGADRDTSDFYIDGNEEAVASVIKNNGQYKTKFIEVFIGEDVAVVDLVAQYAGVYYILMGGSNIPRYKGIGNFILYLEIEDAIRNRCQMVDCFQIDYGWKHRYFDQVKAYKLER